MEKGKDMQMMQAIRFHDYGDIDVLVFEQAPIPEPRDEDVLIRVHATSVNPIDWKIRAGYLKGWLDFPLPWILGLDVSGTVVGKGSAVTQFSVGDEVMARGELLRSGAYAEFTVVKAEHVVAKPMKLTHLEAGATPQGTVTAWNVLVKTCQVSSGQTVLIHGAAGGVGTFAVQIAKHFGAKVIATASPNNHEFLRSLGADELIDYTAVRFEDAVKPVDIVFDTIGGETLQRSFSVVKPGGYLVSVVETPSQELAEARGIKAKLVSADVSQEILREIARLIEAGKIKVVVSAVFPLSEIKKAHALSESMHTRGKIGISIID
ncbi:MAG: NADP-dependent oxidoreductase [Anaerolineaceae bacterium]|nr:NADP-dependent oxidoreductase [Anaerolineaceae bacterium]